MTLLLSNDDVLRVLDPAACIEALEVAFRDLATGEAVNRPRSHTYTPLGDGHFYLFKSMDGAIPRLGVQAIRMSSDHTHEFRRDGKRRREKLPLAPGGRFVVCHAAPALARTRSALEAAGMRIAGVLEVVPRAGRAPLVAVITGGWPGSVSAEAPPATLVVRDGAGAWTPEFRLVRRSMGQPDAPPGPARDEDALP